MKAGDTFTPLQDEPFSSKVLVEGLQSPWNMAINRNGHLWVTELGGNILLVNAKTGKHQVIHHFDDVVNGGQQAVVNNLVGVVDRKFTTPTTNRQADVRNNIEWFRFGTVTMTEMV